MKNADMPSMPTGFEIADLGFVGVSNVADAIKFNSGLTKREMFAMHAMQGELAGSANHSRPDPEDVAHFAVKCADALLKELDK